MKKILTLLLALLMLFTLAGCGTDGIEEKPVDVPVAEINEPEQEELVGGYVDVEDGTLTDELKDIFSKATDGLLGATYEPVQLIATQVVAGTNYMFLANGKKTTNPIIKGTYYIYINEDLDGNVSLLDIETKEEEQEETVDPTQYSYWVVFKNPDGNELQRTIEKYGATPVYTGDTPVYWDTENWYKFTGWNQELKPIITNTYITAEYKFGGELQQEEEPAPAPTPVPTPPVMYTVTFDMQGHGEKIQPYSNVPFDSKISKPDYPSEEESDFLGWYKGTDFIEKWDFDKDTVTSNITLYAGWKEACLAKGTLITMADGLRKPIEDLYEGDLIRVFDHNTGKVSSAKIMDYWQYEEKKSGLITLHFTNDIDVNIVDSHCFYNKEENKYILLRSSNIDNYVGKHFYNVDNDSWETLLGATYSDEKVDTFFIATEGQFDCVAEGMLNVEDGIYYVLRNTFDFDENMKVDQIKKASDIQRFGLYERNDFEYLTEDAFEKYGFANLKVALGKGIITEEFLDILKAESITYESENIVEEYIPENVQHSAR